MQKIAWNYFRQKFCCLLRKLALKIRKLSLKKFSLKLGISLTSLGSARLEIMWNLLVDYVSSSGSARACSINISKKLGSLGSRNFGSCPPLEKSELHKTSKSQCQLPKNRLHRRYCVWVKRIEKSDNFFNNKNKEPLILNKSFRVKKLVKMEAQKKNECFWNLSRPCTMQISGIVPTVQELIRACGVAIRDGFKTTPNPKDSGEIKSLNPVVSSPAESMLTGITESTDISQVSMKSNPKQVGACLLTNIAQQKPVFFVCRPIFLQMLSAHPCQMIRKIPYLITPIVHLIQ